MFCTNPVDDEYAQLVKEVLCENVSRPDRTGNGTISKFGTRSIYDLRNGFPLLTTKKICFENICEELVWFLHGNTDSKKLDAKGVKIWNMNGSKKFLESRGLAHRREGDLGPIYGFQWRHFGAKYRTCDDDYTGQGVDQVTRILRELCLDPYSRRMVMSAWNPSQLDEMALPPCHIMAQFYVENDGRLSCALYQRSGDLALGVPYNIASYSLLTHLLAHLSGREVGSFIHFIGDCHIYLPHISSLKRQIKRPSFSPPQLCIPASLKDLSEVTSSCFALQNYKSHDPIYYKFCL